MNSLTRIIVLIDMDCFYCQVEENLNSNLKDKPVAVIQSNDWKGGGIIAVNYIARDKGVTRHMRGDDAKEKCPDIQLVKVPQVRGKSDLNKYREAGKRVADVLLTFTHQLERASVDEAYLDITNLVDNRLSSHCDITIEKLRNTYVVGNTIDDFVSTINCDKEMHENDVRLVVGGMIAEEIREKIFFETRYKCSAGIAHNKILAKLVCGINKPNKQTILPQEAVQYLFRTMPLKKIKGLGGKFGQTVTEKLNIIYMGDILHFSQKEIIKIFDEKMGIWLYNLARGVDLEPVCTRLLAKSISCCKQFQGRSVLTSREDVEHWLHELTEEMFERLEKDLEENNRKGKQMTVSYSHGSNKEQSHYTRSVPLHCYDVQFIYDNALKIIDKNCCKSDRTFSIKYLGLSVGNFEPIRKDQSIKTFLTNMREKNVTSEKSQSKTVDSEVDSDKRTLETFDENIFNAVVVNPDYLSVTQTEHNSDDNHVYFEEVCPDSIKDQSFVDIVANDKKTPPYNINDNNSKEKSLINSFFTKYYEHSLDRVASDTSKCFWQEESFSTDSHISEIATSSENSYKDNNSIKMINCEVCQKTILSKDYQVHIDFHYALDLVKNENNLYKSVVEAPLTEKLNTPKNTKKQEIHKKGNSSKMSKSIIGYFQNSSKEIDEHFSKLCTECNKRVLVEDFEVHADFHVAKKIRLEQSMNQNKTFLKNKFNKSGKSQNGIATFFKRY